jgi:hypothetical protein
MSSKIKFELNRSGVAELLHSSEMSDVLMEYAQQVGSNAGEGYIAKQMPTRVIVVEAYTDEAKEDNLRNNTLLKAVHS